jgi:hypothetical protein
MESDKGSNIESSNSNNICENKIYNFEEVDKDKNNMIGGGMNEEKDGVNGAFEEVNKIISSGEVIDVEGDEEIKQLSILYFNARSLNNKMN